MSAIDRLEMRNFLSFRKRTLVELSPGLNVVTGPNGSGKTNLLRSIFYGYIGVATMTHWYEAHHSPVVKCTPQSKALLGSIQFADRVHALGGVDMTPEGRAALALPALA